MLTMFPIDWQLDFKSGYRWSEKIWASRLSYSHLPGVDVKVPWELSRMQHLPQLALRASILGENDNEARLLVREIRNQWLDFIATNPPGFGVKLVVPYGYCYSRGELVSDLGYPSGVRFFNGTRRSNHISPQFV